MVWWEYTGEELALFWESPYGNGREKIATFWWPLHPPEKTEEVERLFEQIAASASTPKSDSTASTTHDNPKSDKLTSCQTDSD